MRERVLEKISLFEISMIEGEGSYNDTSIVCRDLDNSLCDEYNQIEAELRFLELMKLK